ncbi:hypothetical protein MFMK1_003385 [Metallumcola ferriviriculae]|uniref:Uncharacterized protein n=1 Tax=Metallumcola ferriviriculae TaxID=3039180 RepID=A0AAU0USV6_9FIRM|nr:hypothetical protein MFMK1_003385 [Desulfitibacteraceae bacterium MK1]
MYEYTAVIDYFDKDKAQRTVRITVQAKNKKEAIANFNRLGQIKKIIWESVPIDNMDDNQLELF